MNEQLLKPCPFCGDKAHLDVFEYKCDDDSYSNELIIIWPNCGAVMHGSLHYGYYDFSDEEINDVIKSWNRRVDNAEIR